MILSDETMTKFKYRGDELPLRCDLLVLEKIQEKIGDIQIAEYEIKGFKPRIDADGVMDISTGRWTIPNIGLVIQSLVWMLEEAREVTNGQYAIPSVKELKQQGEYTINDLSLLVYTEFSSCIAGKKKKKKTTTTKSKKKTVTETASTNA